MGVLAHSTLPHPTDFRSPNWALWPMFAFLSPTIFIVAVSRGFSNGPAPRWMPALPACSGVIGAPREADFKEESSGEQGRENSTFVEKEGTQPYIGYGCCAMQLYRESFQVGKQHAYKAFD